MNARQLRRISVRAFLVWGSLSVAGFFMATPIIALLAPLMEFVVDAMQSDYLSHLSVVDKNGNLTVLMSCTMTHRVRLPTGRIIPFLESFDCAGTTAMHVLVPLIIFLMVVLVWPMRDRRERLRR